MYHKPIRFLFTLMVGVMLSPTISKLLADEPLVLISSFAAGDAGGIQGAVGDSRDEGHGAPCRGACRHLEQGGAGQLSLIVHFQMRPSPLAK